MQGKGARQNHTWHFDAGDLQSQGILETKSDWMEDNPGAGPLYLGGADLSADWCEVTGLAAGYRAGSTVGREDWVRR
jgi:hypothetical protein